MIHVQINAMTVGAGILRVSCRLYDGSGSMKMVLTKDIASNVLQKNLSELILSITAPNNAYINNNLFQSSQTLPSEFQRVLI